MGEFAIGQPVPRFEDPRLVKGHGRYVADMVFPGMAFGYVLRSPHAHARIRSIDTAKAKSTPGVRAVLTSAEYKAAGFVHLEGNKEATDAAFARAAHVVKHRFVINRVTAATMEPRGCIGIFEPIEGRYTFYTTLQRTNVFQTELSQFVLKVPDSKIRVVCGDIGGSFGMKSAVYSEVALVLCAAKLTGRPVKWVATRSESFLCDAQGRDNVTEAELALDQNGTFLGFRARVTAAIGAYLQTGMPAFTGNLGTLAGVYRTPASDIEATAVFTHTQPVRPYRGN